jgi:ribosomal protein L39E
VTKIGELGTTQAATRNRRSPIFVTLMKEAPGSSETSVLARATRRNNPEDTILQQNVYIPGFQLK